MKICYWIGIVCILVFQIVYIISIIIYNIPYTNDSANSIYISNSCVLEIIEQKFLEENRKFSKVCQSSYLQSPYSHRFLILLEDVFLNETDNCSRNDMDDYSFRCCSSTCTYLSMWNKINFEFPNRYRGKVFSLKPNSKTITIKKNNYKKTLEISAEDGSSLINLENPKKLPVKLICKRELKSFVVTNCLENFLLIADKNDRYFTKAKKYCGFVYQEIKLQNSSLKILFKYDIKTVKEYKCLFKSLHYSKNGKAEKEKHLKRFKRNDNKEKKNEDKSGEIDSKCACGISGVVNVRIVGGKVAEKHEFPWQIALSDKSGKVFCGGTLIDDRTILTAAHCIFKKKAEDIVVILGEHDLSRTDDTVTKLVDVRKIIQHPQYNHKSPLHDVAILKLKKHIEFNDKMRPPCFPIQGMNYTDRKVTVSGWGATVDGGGIYSVLQKVALPLVPADNCTRAFEPGADMGHVLCAGYKEGGKDACQGDSGGPMVFNDGTKYTLIGIVSWGQGCAHPDTPGVYMKVERYLTFIRRHTKKSKTCGIAYRESKS